MKRREMAFSKNVSYVLEQLEQKGEGYLVGGCVRDILLGKEPHDYDFCTNLSYEDLQQIFKQYPCFKTGKSFGVFRVQIDGEEFEIAKFRSDEGSDGRRPRNIRFVETIEEDLARRDFTINAMAYHQRKGFLDIYGGKEDLRKKQIRLVGNPAERIREDGLRIMRAFRFVSQLGFRLEENTKRAIAQEKQMLQKIAKSRITEEWNKLVVGDFVMEALTEMRNTGVLEMLFPSLQTLYNFPQNSPYHCYDLWEHTLHVVQSVPNDLILRLAAIFHDIGKPLTKTVDEKTGYYHFYGHEKKGAEIIGRILQGELEEPNSIKKEVEFLIANHMLLHQNVEERNIRNIISRFGEERSRKLVQLSMADNLAKNLKKISDKNPEELFYKIIKEPIPGLSDLAVNGFDLMKLGYVGKDIQKIKEYLLEQVLERRIENEGTVLLEEAKKVIKNKILS